MILMHWLKKIQKGKNKTKQNKTNKQTKKKKKNLTQSIQEIWDTMKRENLRMIGIKEGEDSQFKGPENIFNKIIEENIPNLKKEMDKNVQEVYRIPIRLTRKENPPTIKLSKH